MQIIKYPNRGFLKRNLRAGDLLYLLPKREDGTSTRFYKGFVVVVDILPNGTIKTDPSYFEEKGIEKENTFVGLHLFEI